MCVCVHLFVVDTPGDSTFPGVAALVISMGLQPLVDPARTYLEGYILSKWSVC